MVGYLLKLGDLTWTARKGRTLTRYLADVGGMLAIASAAQLKTNLELVRTRGI